MEPTRDRITKSLHERSGDVVFGEPPTREILAAGNRLRRRRAALVGASSVAAVVAIMGIGWAIGGNPLSGDGDTAVPADAPTSVLGTPRSSDPTTDDDAVSESDDSDTAPPPVGVELTSCADIPRFPADSVDDYTVDTENGILTFGYPTDTGERTVNVAYDRDEGCRTHPDISQVITFLERLGSL